MAPFDRPVLMPAALPGPSVNTSAALPVAVAPSGLSSPRLVAALGQLRGGNELLDNVVIDVRTRTIYISLNRGDGTIVTPTSFVLTISGALITAVAVGDVTADGKPDLVIADSAHNTVFVLPGNGDGTFGAPISYSLGATAVLPGSLAVADLNGDGKLDIVTGNIGSVTVLLNNGSGGLNPAQTYAAPVTANCTGGCRATVTLGDVNGDTRPDIVTTTTLAPNVNQIAVLLNNGSGAFAAATLYTTGGGPIAVAIDDVNGDSKPDLAVANNRDSTVSILLNGNGSGIFTAQTAYPVGANPLGVTLSDQNRDGKLDIVTADRTGSMTILHGKGDGTFLRTALPVGNGPQDVITPVLTGSGRHDLVIANTVDHTLSVLLNNGDGTFTPATGPPIPLGSAPNALAAADFTGDGKTDLAVATASGAIILPGDGTGGFGIPATLPVPGAFFTAIVAADLGNGHQDLVMASTNGTQAQVLLNNGSGTFTAAPGSPIPLGVNPHGLVVADLGNGHPDLIVGLENRFNQTDGSVAVLLGDGTGAFTAAPNSPIIVGAVAPGVAVADMNGDGKKDIVVLSTASGTANDTVSLLSGNGNGTFGVPVALPAPPGTAPHTFGALTIADLDGDGALDLAVTDACTGVGCVELYKGSGTGAFAAAGTYEFGQAASPVFAQENVVRSVDLGGGYPSLVTVGVLRQGTPSNAGVVNLLRNRFVPPSAATHLIFSAPLPATLITGKPFSVAVAAVDASGALVTGFDGTVGLSLNGGSGLSGTLTQTAVIGGTLFLGLTMGNPGTGLTITATSGTLTGTSSSFTATGPTIPPFPLPPPQQPGPVQVGPPIALPPPRPTVPGGVVPNPLPASRP